MRAGVDNSNNWLRTNYEIVVVMAGDVFMREKLMLWRLARGGAEG